MVYLLAHIGRQASKGNESLYASVFEVLVARSPVVPEPLTVPPIRDMDEAMETFGRMPKAWSEIAQSAHGDTGGSTD